MRGITLRRTATAAILLLLAPSYMLPFGTPAYATTAEPDTVSLSGIEIFKDLLVTDDFLAIVPYEVSFTTAPSDGIDKTFIFRLLSPDGSTENGTALANPAYTGGYGSGTVSFYIPTGMTWESAYIFRVQENPSYYPTPRYWDFVISNSNYSTANVQADGLKAKIVDNATFLTTAFSTELLTTSASGQTVLSTYGELYYLQAIPGLQSMCPKLFSVQLETPDYTKRSWSYTLANTLQTKYAGTPLYDFMTGFAGLFSLQRSTAMNFLSVIIFAFLVGLSLVKWKASMLSAFVDGYACLLLLMLMGFFSMIWAGFLAFASTVMGGIILFLNRS